MRDKLLEINKLFHEMGFSASGINYGNCYHWAYVAHLVTGGDLCSSWGHAFIKINGKYYDSECLHGANNWKKLRAAQNDYRLSVYETCRFQKHWARVGANKWNKKLILEITNKLRLKKMGKLHEAV